VREQQVLQYLDAGLTQKQIARAEGSSDRTIRRLITRLRSKLAAPSLFVLGANAVRRLLV
jgi:DNA-binding NarL/FixJ family response regulator